MSNRTIHLALLIVLGATAIAIAWCSPPYERMVTPVQRRSPLALVPSGAEIVITADIERLRATTLGRLFTAQGRQLPEIGSLERVCGFDPTERIQEIVVAVPSATLSAQGQTDFGITVVGDFEAGRLVGCASSVVKHRGGEPAATPIGSFTTIRDRRNAASGEVAIRNGGPALMGGGGYLRDLIDVIEGRERSALDEGIHGALRGVVDPAGDGAIVASWLPGPAWFDAVDSPATSPWRALRGLALRVGVSPDLALTLVLACAREVGCDGLASAVQQLRSKLARPASELFGLDLDRVMITNQAQHIDISLRLSPREARAFIERVLQTGPTLGAPR